MPDTNLIPITELAQWLRERLKIELKDQGHVATGALLRSIDFDIYSEGSTIRLDFKYLDYGVDLDTGVPASAIPATGPATTARINDLAKWVRQRGIEAGALARTVAFFIHRTHTVTGVPSPGAYRFTNNGRRTGWVTYTLQDRKREIEAKSEDAIEQIAIELLIDIFVDIAGSNRYIYVQ